MERWFRSDRRAVTLVAILALVACGRKAEEEEPEPAEVPTITADTAAVTRRTLLDELTVRGIVAALPNGDVKVSSQVAGRIDSLTVAEGDEVQQGQVIATIDRRPIEEQRRQALAALEQAKAQVENARLNLQRNEQLFARGIAAGKEVEDARTQMATAQAALDQATATVNTASLQLERTDVRTPITGQIVKRMVSVGEQVDGTGTEPIVQVANLDRVELAANVPAADLSRIRTSQPATVTTTTYAGREFPGSVIALAPAVDPTTNTALVRIRINNNAQRDLKVGMSAEARLRLSEHANALTVPVPAIVKTGDGAFLYVVSSDMAERTPVKIGLETKDAVEILSGVTEGQTVLTSSVYGLGEKARLAKPEKADSRESP